MLEDFDLPALVYFVEMYWFQASLFYERGEEGRGKRREMPTVASILVITGTDGEDSVNVSVLPNE